MQPKERFENPINPDCNKKVLPYDTCFLQTYNVIDLRWRYVSSGETPLWKGKDNERYLDCIDTKQRFKTQYSHEKSVKKGNPGEPL